jgi:hypothetical protein
MHLVTLLMPWEPSPSTHYDETVENLQLWSVEV